jgi:Bacterial membrane protein YfhO
MTYRGLKIFWKSNNGLPSSKGLTGGKVKRKGFIENFSNSSRCHQKEWIKDLFIILFLAFLVVLKFWDYLNPFGHFFWIGDFLEVAHIRDFFYQNLKNGTLALWYPHMATGMPYLALEYGVLYPIDFLIGVLGQHYFVSYRLSLIHAFHYWLGGVFAFIYARQLGLSRFPSLTSAVCFMLGGFMMGHAYHRNVIQGYIWFPLILYFLDKALQERKTIWAVLAGVFLAFSFLGGHANFFYFIILFLAFYFLFRVYRGAKGRSWSSIIGDARYFLVMGVFCLGISAMQWVPIVLTSLRTLHGTLPFEWKAQIPFQLSNLIHFLIPDYTRWVAFDIGEQYGYIGLLPLVLALWGVYRTKESQVRFFVLVAFFAFIASLGQATPLYKILYYSLPGLSQFRVPARFNTLIIFPLAVLAGYGFQCLLDQGDRGPSGGRKISIQILLYLFLGMGLAIFFYLRFFYLSSEPGNFTPGPWVLLRKGLFWFLFLWGTSYALISLKTRFPSALLFKLSIVVLVSIDLLFLGRIEGGGSKTDPAFFSPQALTILKEIKKEGDLFRIGNREKILSPLLLSREGIPDYDVGNLVGYVGTVVPQEYLGIYFLIRNNPMLLDLLNVKYYIGARPKIDDSFGEIKLGGKIEEREFYLNYPMKISSLSIYSALSNSASIPQGQTVARITLEKKDGSRKELPIRAGMETSEWAIDRPGLNCAHQKAPVIESWEMPHERFQGHAYIFKALFPQPLEVSKIRFQYLSGRGELSLKNILFNGVEITRTLEKMIEDHFRWIAPDVYQNKTVLPRVFMVGKARAIADDKALLKNLEKLDPREMVLVNHLPPGYHEPDHPSFSVREAKISEYSLSRVQINTHAREDKFLILSDAYSPYWKATIDQKHGPILKADYGLRGVYVPKGDHRIDFSFYFNPFYYGLVVTCFTLLAAVVFFILAIRRNFLRRQSSEKI